MAGTYYILRVDGVGEYGARHESGAWCLFVFASEKTISDFVERKEMPEHKRYTSVAFEIGLLIDFLSTSRATVQAVAVDPPTDFEFVPVAFDDFLDHLRRQV